MPQSASIIDTLSEGYRAIHRRPLTLLLVLALNLILLFSAPVSFAPLFERLDGFLTRLANDPAAVANAEQQGQAGELLRELGQTDLRQPLALLNALPRFVAPRFETGALTGISSTIEIATLPGALLVLTVVNLVILPISALFLTLVGAAVRGEPALPQSLGRSLARIGAALVGLLAVFLAASLLLGVPLLVIAGLLLFLNNALGALAFSLLFIVAVWVQIYVGFANEAIVISKAGPLNAIIASFNLVRRNLWGTVGLLLLTLLISRGTEIIWGMLGETIVGQVTAAIGSAYIGAGLMAARMAFYQDRTRLMESATKK